MQNHLHLFESNMCISLVPLNTSRLDICLSELIHGMAPIQSPLTHTVSGWAAFCCPLESSCLDHGGLSSHLSGQECRYGTAQRMASKTCELYRIVRRKVDLSQDQAHVDRSRKCKSSLAAWHLCTCLVERAWIEIQDKIR